jgi:putative membrane protein
MMYYDYFDPFAALFHIIGWVLLVMFIIWIVRHLRGHRHAHRRDLRDMWYEHSHGPMDILKERYAKGEINKEEYEEKKRVLSQ